MKKKINENNKVKALCCLSKFLNKDKTFIEHEKTNLNDWETKLRNEASLVDQIKKSHPKLKQTYQNYIKVLTKQEQEQFKVVEQLLNYNNFESYFTTHMLEFGQLLVYLDELSNFVLDKKSKKQCITCGSTMFYDYTKDNLCSCHYFIQNIKPRMDKIANQLNGKCIESDLKKNY